GLAAGAGHVTDAGDVERHARGHADHAVGLVPRLDLAGARHLGRNRPGDVGAVTNSPDAPVLGVGGVVVPGDRVLARGVRGPQLRVPRIDSAVEDADLGALSNEGTGIQHPVTGGGVPNVRRLHRLEAPGVLPFAPHPDPLTGSHRLHVPGRVAL